jgi:hypothetical protein
VSSSNSSYAPEKTDVGIIVLEKECKCNGCQNKKKRDNLIIYFLLILLILILFIAYHFHEYHVN